MIEQRQWVRSWWPLLPLARHRVAVSLLVIGLGLFSAQALKQVDRDLRGLYTEYTLAATDLAHIMTDAGLILIASITDIDDYELNMLKTLNNPNKTLVINVGENQFSQAMIDLTLPKNADTDQAIKEIVDLLVRSVVLDPEYFI